VKGEARLVLGLRAIARLLLWLVGTLVEGLKWLLTISVLGLIFGFWQFVGWDAGRTLIPCLLGGLGK